MKMLIGGLILTKPHTILFVKVYLLNIDNHYFILQCSCFFQLELEFTQNLIVDGRNMIMFTK